MKGLSKVMLLAASLGRIACCIPRRKEQKMVIAAFLIVSKNFRKDGKFAETHALL